MLRASFVIANAKNSFGGYTDLKGNMVLIAGGSIIDVIPPRSQKPCDALVPFPELDGKVAARWAHRFGQKWRRKDTITGVA